MANETEAEVREMFTEKFSDVSFPATEAVDLVPGLPKGARTQFEIAGQDISALEMSTALEGHEDFPYENADELIDDVIDAVQAEGYLESE